MSMNPYSCQKRKVTPKIALAIMKKNGIVVDEAKAAEILDFMYFLAGLVVKQHFADGIDKIAKKED